MSLGALAFLNPWLLLGLAALPAIWWLLRTVPPRPRRIDFPPTRILVDIENREQTPAKTPWWLTLIRILAAALVILALAEPILNPERGKALTGSGPVVIVIDNGWALASHWPDRRATIERLIAEAEGAGRSVVIVPTAFTSKRLALKLDAPAAARSTAAAVEPLAFAPDRTAAASALAQTLRGKSGISLFWLTDGIDHEGKAKSFVAALKDLVGSGSFTVIDGAANDTALALGAGLGPGGKLVAKILSIGGGAREGMVYAFSARGQRLAETPFKLGPGEAGTQITFDMPLELRNQITRVEIAGERSAGAVNLLDARSRWHRVGLISGESREEAQPLLAPLYYIDRALAPYAELVRPASSNVSAGIDSSFKQRASILMLADIGTISDALGKRVREWVKKGGILVRFAGPRLEQGGDDLLPVGLRVGGRSLGGALSWSTPQPLAAFSDETPFAGLAIPPDVLVNRQVLADPVQLSRNVKIWARLKDGTPLVTARRLGDGEIILFHVTANSDWSNLPLSGLFVEMLQRITARGRLGGPGSEPTGLDTASKSAKEEAATASAKVLAPVEVLSGYGVLKPPPPTAEAIAEGKIFTTTASAAHPPGYYGPSGSPRALNIIGAKTKLKPLPALPFGVERRVMRGAKTTPLKPWMLGAALALLFADVLAVLALQSAGAFLGKGKAGAGRAARAGATTTGALLLALAFAAAPPVPQAQAQAPAAAPPAAAPPAAAPLAAAPPPPASRLDDQFIARATGKVTFGYVLTGDEATDTVSRQGLNGLSLHLRRRTAVDPGDPFGVNIVTDEIAFYPVLYWPVLQGAKALPDATLAKIDAYMKQGGLIIFDTRDFGSGLPTGFSLSRRGTSALQRLLGKLDIPRLEPVPEGHVLTKSFYLLSAFPGRWQGGELWVEADAGGSTDGRRQARRADGVSSILVTSNDFAAAWAVNARGRSIYPTVPGGPRQREMAFRTGVNIVMYALTGNYKADQVHIPALLERLGQ